MIDEGRQVTIIDLRHALDSISDPRLIPGAIRMLPDDITSQAATLPREQEIVLYCTWPNEASSARVAQKLHAIGFTRVRPLQGGFHGWKELNFPLVESDIVQWNTAEWAASKN
jgi:rhodanese-related sulfurtransferase